MKYPPTSQGDVAALDRVRVVLVRTSLPRNIGSVARAMKTMGLHRLALVAPRSFPHPEAIALASGASDVLDRTQVHASLDEALAGVSLAIGLTARRRELSHRSSDMRAAAVHLLEALDRGGEAALVFGTEMSGLSNDEIMHCSRVAYIPANPAYSSLNVAMAVQIACYELWMALAKPRVLDTGRQALATHEEIEQLHAHLERSLIASGFLDPQQPRRLTERLRRLFGRAQLEREEINILRGMLNSFESLERKS